jgi:predicted nucleic acid-binding Zn ribbon protein
MQKIDAQSMDTYQAKPEKNLFARPETEGEKAAAKVMKYISDVSDHIPGSVGDVNDMRSGRHTKVGQDRGHARERCPRSQTA